MKPFRNRYPQIGDMLIVYPGNRRNDTHPTRRECFVGIVNKIVKDKYGHQKSVFVIWQGEVPQMYNRDHGYAGVNIHNMRREFRVFRNGEEIK